MAKRRQMSYSRGEYISGAPGIKISKFKVGEGGGGYKTLLVSKETGEIKQESLESARVVVNKILENTLGIDKYSLRVMIYPHLIMREHKQLGVAGADRLSDGMRNSFGKARTRVAKVKNGQTILEVASNPANKDVLMNALKSASYKLPIPTSIVTEDSTPGDNVGA